MFTESKSYAGGEKTILNIFTDSVDEKKKEDNVNQLILNCSKSKESLSVLYTMFKKNVFAIAFTITSDYHLAEDCVIETFVRLSQVKKFNPENGDGKGYIYTIARNVALELRRQHRRDTDNFIMQSYGETDTAVENSIYINQLMMFLNDKQKQVVTLRCFSELSFRQIAKIMKCPESTVKSRYEKAIAILREKAGVHDERRNKK
ncbi:MAG: sigma-70 family RNA polymerase sigma factor [Ruminococcus sp.]|nr:sigma-70 family RNA polymerase sigma factor [Ruminococcus sp.]MDE7226205.1 sigma-70 family RNA polymerase sigma factor [Ruminococcus sp.]